MMTIPGAVPRLFSWHQDFQLPGNMYSPQKASETTSEGPLEYKKGAALDSQTRSRTLAKIYLHSRNLYSTAYSTARIVSWSSSHDASTSRRVPGHHTSASRAGCRRKDVHDMGLVNRNPAQRTHQLCPCMLTRPIQLQARVLVVCESRNGPVSAISFINTAGIISSFSFTSPLVSF